jgi:hypothetical protein
MIALVNERIALGRLGGLAPARLALCRERLVLEEPRAERVDVLIVQGGLGQVELVVFLDRELGGAGARQA